MPTYCFQCPKCAATTEKVWPQQRFRDRPRCRCGARMNRDMGAEHGQYRQTPGNWPMKSDALGCGVDQIEESREASVKMGVPTDFDSEGRAILNSPEHRKRYAEAMGIFDRNGGYGDPRRPSDRR